MRTLSAQELEEVSGGLLSEAVRGISKRVKGIRGIEVPKRRQARATSTRRGSDA